MKKPILLLLFFAMVLQGCEKSSKNTEVYREAAKEIPVIAITTAADNLYGDSIGIYCVGVNGINARNSGRNSNINMDWERPVNFEYITADGKMAVNQEVEMSVAGGWSRHYAPASFKLKARNLYESEKQFNYPFFARKPYNKYKVLLVRNGDNDIDAFVASIQRQDRNGVLTFYVPADHATKSFYLEPYNNIHFSRYAIYLHVKD